MPRDLETIFLKCLAKAPGNRYGSTEALADDLRRFLEGRPIQAKPAGIVGRLFKWSRRQPAAAAGILVVGAGIVLLQIASIGLASSQHRQRVLAEELTLISGGVFSSIGSSTERLRRREVAELAILQQQMHRILNRVAPRSLKTCGTDDCP